MDLYSGIPYWIAKDPLYQYYNPLRTDYNVDVLIVGSGITGALIAHELCNAGIECAVVDKRNIGTGSTVASTALLQYEIDTPLIELIKKRSEEEAVLAYRSCLKSISDIQHVFNEINFNPDFKNISSLFYASNRKGHELLVEEYKIRKKYDLPVEYISRKELKKTVGIKAPAALKNDVSAKMDTYLAATHLILHHLEKKELNVFSHTEITQYNENKKGYTVSTNNGHEIKCKYIIVAAGFESEQFLPKKVMQLISTYAIVSNPIDQNLFWPEKSLLWETRQPYLYIRTSGNRIIVGGEDENFRDPIKRDKLLRSKVKTLEKKFNKLFPHIPFKTDMAWCGTFSTTDDGLPFIGTWPEKERMFFALGYGGNGITFSMIAAQMIRNKLLGKHDSRQNVFGFERLLEK